MKKIIKILPIILTVILLLVLALILSYAVENWKSYHSCVINELEPWTSHYLKHSLLCTFSAMGLIGCIAFLIVIFLHLNPNLFHRSNKTNSNP